jgi:hypothetical protein
MTRRGGTTVDRATVKRVRSPTQARPATAPGRSGETRARPTPIFFERPRPSPFVRQRASHAGPYAWEQCSTNAPVSGAHQLSPLLFDPRWRPCSRRSDLPLPGVRVLLRAGLWRAVASSYKVVRALRAKAFPSFGRASPQQAWFGSDPKPSHSQPRCSPKRQS